MLQVNGTSDYNLSFTNKAKTKRNITKKKMWLWGGERWWNKASLYKVRVPMCTPCLSCTALSVHQPSTYMYTHTRTARTKHTYRIVHTRLAQLSFLLLDSTTIHPPSPLAHHIHPLSPKQSLYPSPR